MAIGSRSVEAPESAGLLAPAAWIGAAAVGVLERLGAMVVLVPSAFASIFRRERDDESSLQTLISAELWWMLLAGCPLVALVHVAMGSFLSLQAYYGSTFVDGTGAVVGVGLLRNLASMMTGLTLAGYLPVRIIPELRALRRLQRARLAEADQSSPARRAVVDDAPEPTPAPERLAAARLLAAAIATPLLSLWGFSVGTIIGWRASETLMNLPTATFFLMFLRMIWYRDVIGLMIKGAAFGFVIALIACSEGLRLGASEPTSDEGASSPSPEVVELVSACRAMLFATCLSMAAILLMNMTWFVLVYHAVPVYGPSLLQPPTP